MTGFLYFVPNVANLDFSQADAEAIGLGHAFDGVGLAKRQVQNGPDGLGGIILADERRVSAERMGYFPDRQVWRKMPGGKAYVGMCSDDRPGPECLARQNQVSGNYVDLENGSWLIPLPRKFSNGVHDNALPTVLDVDENGKWTSAGIVARYRRFWDIAVEWYNAKMAAIADEAEGTAKITIVTVADACDAAAELLGCNYAVSKIEIALLGAMTDKNAVAILDASIDWDRLLAWGEQKKTERESATHNT